VEASRRIRGFYVGITGKFSELTTPVLLVEEDRSQPAA
jgi:hypothetical protein